MGFCFRSLKTEILIKRYIIIWLKKARSFRSKLRVCLLSKLMFQDWIFFSHFSCSKGYFDFELHVIIFGTRFLSGCIYLYQWCPAHDCTPCLVCTAVHTPAKQSYIKSDVAKSVIRHSYSWRIFKILKLHFEYSWHLSCLHLVTEKYSHIQSEWVEKAKGK